MSVLFDYILSKTICITCQTTVEEVHVAKLVYARVEANYTSLFQNDNRINVAAKNCTFVT
jgi:hypothetical protein